MFPSSSARANKGRVLTLFHLRWASHLCNQFCNIQSRFPQKHPQKNTFLARNTVDRWLVPSVLLFASMAERVGLIKFVNPK
jgi:hypothetical protein